MPQTAPVGRCRLTRGRYRFTRGRATECEFGSTVVFYDSKMKFSQSYTHPFAGSSTLLTSHKPPDKSVCGGARLPRSPHSDTAMQRMRDSVSTKARPPEGRDTILGRRRCSAAHTLTLTHIDRGSSPAPLEQMVVLLLADRVESTRPRNPPCAWCRQMTSPTTRPTARPAARPATRRH